MKEKDFLISKEDSKNFLNKFNFLKSYDFYKKPLSEKFITISKKKDFLDIYKFAIENSEYHFLLFDDSLIQLEYIVKDKNTTLLRYAYYQSPYDYLGNKEYLLSKGLRFSDVGYNYLDEYEQELTELPLKQPFIAIRYDYSKKEYLCGGHGVSHFHFGYANSKTIRITSSIIINPLLFTLYIIKQAYYNDWKELLKKQAFMRYYNKAKSNCKQIDEKFFKTLDKKELYLI